MHPVYSNTQHRAHPACQIGDVISPFFPLLPHPSNHLMFPDASRFSWRRNGKFFNVMKDPRVSMRKHSGTLEIGFRSGGRPEDYEGEYQCFASNELGNALSNKILLRVSSKEPHEHRNTHTHTNACTQKHTVNGKS